MTACGVGGGVAVCWASATPTDANTTNAIDASSTIARLIRYLSFTLCGGEAEGTRPGPAPINALSIEACDWPSYWSSDPYALARWPIFSGKVTGTGAHSAYPQHKKRWSRFPQTPAALLATWEG